MATYKLFGLGSGLMFILMFVLIYSFFHYKKFTLIHYIAITIIIIGITIAFYNIIKSSITLIQSKKNEIITLIMIPIGAF
jgi:ABC-type transport system involved in cytochrome c biogenesis permease component